MVNYEQWAGTGFTEQALQRFNFIEIILWHGCSPINLMPIFRTTFPKNTTGGLLLGFSSGIWLLCEQTFNPQWPNHFYLRKLCLMSLPVVCCLYFDKHKVLFLSHQHLLQFHMFAKNVKEYLELKCFAIF